MTTLLRRTLIAGVALSALSLAPHAQAQKLIVSQVGTGGDTANTNAATTVVLDQYTTTGTLSGSLSLPSSGGGNYLTETGNSLSEGQLTLSTDGKYLLITGYNAASGTTYTGGLSGTSTTTATGGGPVKRVVGVVTVPTGNISTATVDVSTQTTAFTGTNIRSAASTGGATPYLYSTGGATGIIGETKGATSSTTVYNTITNTRVANIYSGDLYFSTGSGTQGIYKITGTPTAAGSTASLVVGTSNLYDFLFTDANTLYAVTDNNINSGTNPDGTTATSFATLRRFTNSGSGFTQDATFNPVLAGTTANTYAGLRSLTYDGSGTFYAISTDNRLVSFDGTSFSTLATGTAGGVFRGVEYLAAAPEPSSILALTVGAGVLGLLVARRRTAGQSANV